jgi:hypothetical protein
LVEFTDRAVRGRRTGRDDRRSGMGSTVVGALIAALVGLLVAVGTSVSLVEMQTQTPDPVDKPLVVYGDR